MSTDVQNAIFASSKAGYEDDIKELLANPKVDWKAKDGLGNTPLHYAAGILSLFIKYDREFNMLCVILIKIKRVFYLTEIEYRCRSHWCRKIAFGF
jgi:hypothetical protein